MTGVEKNIIKMFEKALFRSQYKQVKTNLASFAWIEEIFVIISAAAKQPFLRREESRLRYKIQIDGVC